MNRKKVELYIQNISSSQTQAGAYALVLGEKMGKRSIPIIVGASEAQAVILELKGFMPPRPLTHQLFANVLRMLNVKLLRMLIYKVENGVYFSYLYLKSENTIYRIDARTSDAITLALHLNAPILAYDDILNNECVKTKAKEVYGYYQSKSHNTNVPPSQEEKLDTLESAMKKAIAEENYEQAAVLRDQINQLHKQ